jgi:hypothetical protein
MKAFLHRANPVTGWRDLRNQLAEPRPYRWRFMALAAAATYAIFAVMFTQEAKGPPRPPEIIYIDSWRADRTDAQIIAGNIAATKERKQREAQLAAGRQRVKEMYKTLGAMSGMDVARIEREAKADEARDAAARAKAEAAAPKPRIERIN